MKIVIQTFLASLLVVCSLAARANGLEPGNTQGPLHHGLTVKKYPSICLNFPQGPPATGTTLFTLVDPERIKPVLEVRLTGSHPSDNNEMCRCVNLGDYGFPLEPDVQYLWSLSIVQDAETRPHDMIAHGMIERCSFDDCVVIMDGPLGCSKDRVNHLVEHGFWYDAAACLCDLISSNPDNEALRRSLSSLFRHGVPFSFPPEPSTQHE